MQTGRGWDGAGYSLRFGPDSSKQHLVAPLYHLWLLVPPGPWREPGGPAERSLTLAGLWGSGLWGQTCSLIEQPHLGTTRDPGQDINILF